ncbi:hypothetical protein M2397_001529 [Pseudomonas sp. BIGb0381]|uniref:BON domain-containing protein n=1 Tax=Pseudomonas sp. BIGb0381 TaxID=2940608 RepID=UPI002169CDFA|nr:BON domain-containing protein [Pseudomonas sp. BIGb0381]MCS4311236.1 hypothetical protein [Pseudomonas sp. BIGb0381]
MNNDETLRQRVMEDLNWDLALKADQILVQVSDRIVTLSGNVASHAERWHAEQAVAHVVGVVEHRFCQRRKTRKSCASDSGSTLGPVSQNKGRVFITFCS